MFADNEHINCEIMWSKKSIPEIKATKKNHISQTQYYHINSYFKQIRQKHLKESTYFIFKQNRDSVDGYILMISIKTNSDFFHNLITRNAFLQVIKLLDYQFTNYENKAIC